MSKKSGEYWKKRFLNIESASNAYGQDVYRQIEPAFDKSQRQIQKEIDVWYSRVAKNNEITIEEAKRLLNTKELKEFRWDVNEYIKYGRENAIDQMWMKELENASARVHINRLEALKVRTQNAVEVAFGNELDFVDKMAREVYTRDYYHSIFEMHKGFNIGWEIGQIDERKLDTLVKKPWAADGKNFSDRVWNSKTKMVNELHQQLVRTCVLGKSPDKAIEELSKYVDKKFENAKIQAGRLVMTEQAYFHSVAQKDAFEELEVEEFEVVATLDSHTSQICQDMDGIHKPMKEYEVGVTAPPFHVWCRSVTVPYFDDDLSPGERAARDADGKTYYVSDKMTYKDWKKSFVDGDTDDLTIIDNNGKIKNEPNIKDNRVIKALEANNVEYRQVEPLESSLSVEQIVDRLGGGDMTKGSCSSLAFGYIGNRNGLDVLDFRGGASQSIFARNSNIYEVAELGTSYVVEDFNDFKAVSELLKNVVQGKEYYLATGSHAAIVRKVDDVFEYLELQSSKDNGFKQLTNGVLKSRFGCKKSHTLMGTKIKHSNVLIDSDSLYGNEVFEILLGYINTAVGVQKKGVSGHIK